MRNLNIEELEIKIHDYALDVEYVEKLHLTNRLHQFLNFLESQSISNRILERIDEDYIELKNTIPEDNNQNWRKERDNFLSIIKTPDQQGALGYFLILKTFKSKNVNEIAYPSLAENWYDCHGDFEQWKDDFITLIFKPFVSLLDWYISESLSYNSRDYFSKIEISEFNSKLSHLESEISKLGLGQEIIFNEIQELNELLKSLKKKNWLEIFKGKFLELVINKTISVKTMEMALKYITGDDINILNN